MITALFLSFIQVFILRLAECDYQRSPEEGFVKWSCTR